MSIKLEEGKFYKTRSGLKVECVKNVPKKPNGRSKVCVIYHQESWGETSYTEDGRYDTDDPCHQRNIISEWTEYDELGIEYGQIVWCRNEGGRWAIGHFVEAHSDGGLYGITSTITSTGELVESHTAYFSEISLGNPHKCSLEYLIKT